MSDKLNKFIKENSEFISIILLAGFLSIVLFIMMRCVDPAESTLIHLKEVKDAQKLKKEEEKERIEHERYKKVIKKIDELQKEKSGLSNGNDRKSIITNLHTNEENIAVQLSKYVNDRGGNQFKGQPENWYISFAEQARMLYR
jgi:hypothetical protein